jgi:membrane protease YdiL (CAAX protease family)
MEPIISWFIVGGFMVFIPIVIGGYLTVRAEGLPTDHREWATRLRLRGLDRGDWLWSVGGLVVTVVCILGVQSVLGVWGVELQLHPSFMAFEPLTPGRYWILLAWLPFWVLNILGEELVWRGAILPRQEVALGRHGWKANAAGWLLFHVAFGWQLLLSLIPIILILPYVVSRRRNTWVGVILHGGLNGPGFIAVALGYV